MSTDYRPRPGAVPTAVVEDLAKLPPVAVSTPPSLRSAIDTAAAHLTRTPQLELPGAGLQLLRYPAGVTGVPTLNFPAFSYNLRCRKAGFGDFKPCAQSA